MATQQNPLVGFISPRLPSHQTSGFTLLELIVVILIMGILTAIAIPSFANQAKRAKEAEARSTVGSINRAQQLYFAENSQFGSLEDLELKLSNSRNYTYDSEPEAIDVPVALTTATPDAPALRGFAGKVWLTSAQENGEVSQAILCEGELGEVPEVDETACLQ
jgi:type IV pilus assembly protein PilA